MEVLGPKGPHSYTGTEMVGWAHSQLTIADEIMDNPGGGLIFATTSVGQVKAALTERAAQAEKERHRWEPVVDLLDVVEDDLVRRRFEAARRALRKAMQALADEEDRKTA